MPLRVFVLSDVRLYSEGLAALRSAEPTIDVVGAAALDDAAIRLVRSGDPHILLVDAIALRSGAIQDIVAAAPSALIVACGVREERDEVIACAQRGAAGYVARDASPEDLINIVLSVERGELPCSPRIAAMLFRQMAAPHASGAGGAASRLTSRERDVVALIDRGMSNKEIGAALGIELAGS